MPEDTTDPLADRIDRLLDKEDLTVPGIAGRLARQGIETDDLQELIAVINRRKYQQ